MSQLSLDEFNKWYPDHKSELDEILKKEGIAGNSLYRGRSTSIGAAVVEIIDPFDLTKIIHTTLVAVSNSEITDALDEVAKTHHVIVNEKQLPYNVTDTILQIDGEGKIVSHTIREIKQSKK